MLLFWLVFNSSKYSLFIEISNYLQKLQPATVSANNPHKKPWTSLARNSYRAMYKAVCIGRLHWNLQRWSYLPPPFTLLIVKSYPFCVQTVFHRLLVGTGVRRGLCFRFYLIFYQLRIACYGMVRKHIYLCLYLSPVMLGSIMTLFL